MPLKRTFPALVNQATTPFNYRLVNQATAIIINNSWTSSLPPSIDKRRHLAGIYATILFKNKKEKKPLVYANFLWSPAIISLYQSNPFTAISLF